MSADQDEFEIVDYLRRASVAVYIAMDAVAADDLSPHLKAAADLIERLQARVDELEEIVDQDAHDLEDFQQRLQTTMWHGRDIAEQMESALALLETRGQPMVIPVTP